MAIGRQAEASGNGVNGVVLVGDDGKDVLIGGAGHDIIIYGDDTLADPS